MKTEIEADTKLSEDEIIHYLFEMMISRYTMITIINTGLLFAIHTSSEGKY